MELLELDLVLPSEKVHQMRQDPAGSMQGAVQEDQTAQGKHPTSNTSSREGRSGPNAAEMGAMKGLLLSWGQW